MLVHVIGGQEFVDESMRWQEQYGDPQNMPQGPPNMPSGKYMGVGIGYLVLMGLQLLTYFGAGVLAAMWAPWGTKTEAALVGAIAGGVAELIHRPVAMISSIVFSLLSPYGQFSPLETIISSLICCLPVMLIIGIILAAIGALLYSLIKKKPAPSPGVVREPGTVP